MLEQHMVRLLGERIESVRGLPPRSHKLLPNLPLSHYLRTTFQHLMRPGRQKKRIHSTAFSRNGFARNS
jgi:hypothetical protein